MHTTYTNSPIEQKMQSPAGEKKPGVGVYTYVAQWALYSLAWTVRRDKRNRLAVGSFLEDYTNKVELIQFNSDSGNFSGGRNSNHHRLLLDHPYTPSNLMFYPSEETSAPDLLATSGDYLRLWEIHDDTVELKTLLNGNNSGEFNSAITSFDWSEFEPNRVAASSVDSTCTVWDVEKEALDTQLVAHDKEVYDVSWGGPGVFGSVSADGSVRVFDLRDKERSTIIYENGSGLSGSPDPLLRVEWNKADPRFMATVGMDSSRVVILDIRFPTAPLMELRKHKASVNSMSWAPRTGRHLCSVSDDSRALVWDVVVLGVRPEPGDDDVDPVMWYGSPAELNNVRWSPVEPEWIAVTFLNKMQLLKV